MFVYFSSFLLSSRSSLFYAKVCTLVFLPFWYFFFRHVLDTSLFSCSGGTLLSRICNGLKSVLVVKVLMCLFPVVDVITLPEALFDSVFCFLFVVPRPCQRGPLRFICQWKTVTSLKAPTAPCMDGVKLKVLPSSINMPMIIIQTKLLSVTNINVCAACFISLFRYRTRSDSQHCNHAHGWQQHVLTD